jgi:GH25 family lysozyme M1 (1,4-beta-N-acetylmuramidase)
MHVPPVTDPTPPPTIATEPPEPTLPPPEENPYGPLDFQFKGYYLKLIEGNSITGIDVSSHQKEIDWEAVKASGVDFAMIRIGYRGYESGILTEDPYAKANLEGAAAAGLDVGMYFFSQALNTLEAEEEAYWVLNYIKDYDITMPVVFDWEKVDSDKARTNDMDKRTLTDCSRVFLETIDLAGYTPMLYFNRNQAKYLLYLSELKDYDFWLAAYTDRMTYPYQVQMWQYTNTGYVPGVEGNCDINVYFPDA